MTAKIPTRSCDECQHFDPSWAATAVKRVCLLKHKPMFYKPKDDPRDVNWGFKRRCADFQVKVAA